jgi:hypothetical protein
MNDRLLEVDIDLKIVNSTGGYKADINKSNSINWIFD